MKKILFGVVLLAGCMSPNNNPTPDMAHQWRKLLTLQERMQKLESKVESNLSHFEMRINVLDHDTTSSLYEIERSLQEFDRRLNEN